MRRIIREEEPPKPSTRLTTIQSVNRQTVADVRVAEVPASKVKQKRESIPSDLDWIVMKAMEKDRTRRYESAAAMSDDIRRFLSEEPVEARPPSRRYRLKKFASRNRVALLTSSLVASALVTGTVASLYQASIAITERNEKEAALQDAITARQEVESFAQRLKTANVLVGNARLLEDSQQFAAADSAYGEAVALVPNYYLVWVQRAALRARLLLWEEAADGFSEAMLLEAPIDSRGWEGAAAIFYLTDREDDYREMYSRLMTPPVDDSPSLSIHSIRSCLIAPAGSDDANRLLADAEKLLDRTNGPPGPPGPPRDSGPPDFRGGPPERESERGGRIDRREFGPRGPGSGRRPGGPRGPSFQDRAPRSVEEYVAAWAHLRAGNEEQALKYLDSASQARGPSGDMVHSLRAIALHRLGKDSEALDALERADDALDRTIREKLESPDDRRPWIDFLEMVLLHREATLEVSGQNIGLDPRIEDARQNTRELLGF